MRRATVHIGELGIGPLDVVLRDLAGKHQGVSVATMLGGFRERLPAHASTLGGDGMLRGPRATVRRRRSRRFPSFLPSIVR